MANRIEAAKNYLVSVAERSIGIGMYNRWQRHVDQLDDNALNEEVKRNRRFGGAFLGVMQFAFPALTDSLPKLWTERDSSSINILTAKYAVKSVIIDAGGWGAVYLLTYQNPWEFVIYKPAVNAASHAALDLVDITAKRVRNFRPSGTTLAV